MNDVLDYKNIAEKMFLHLKELRKQNPDKKIIQVCGPITTGGLGSQEKNNTYFLDFIKKLEQKNSIVFNQILFNDEIFKIKDRRKALNLFNYYDWEILTVCFLPLFESGFIDEFIFLSGYEKSIGSQWEYDMALKNKINIIKEQDLL